MNKTYRVAAYGRLSKEDGDKLVSDSIKNQLTMIYDYIAEQPEMMWVDDYVDDGYSGSNFNRPGFKRMMVDIDRGHINCIVVKDLSRFGRNYIESGRYLERIFPTLGVRMIAINDQYDGATEWSQSDSLLIPFKNLINDMYCRDISYKTRTQLDIKRRHGEWVSNFAVYGYQRDTEVKAHLVIDRHAARHVRNIYDWFVQGQSVDGIATRLNQNGVKSPLEYKQQTGLALVSSFKTHEQATWCATAVRRVLTNEVYLGHLVQGKRKRVNYRVKSEVVRPMQEWVRVEDTHEPIITADCFALVQDLLSRDQRCAKGQAQLGVFSGMVMCGACHQNMVIRTVQANGKTYRYFICSTYKMDRSCSTHNISYQKVEAAVLEAIRKMAELAVMTEAWVKKQSSKDLERVRIGQLDEQILTLENEVLMADNKYQHVHEDYAMGIIGENEFKEFSTLYMERLCGKQRALETLRQTREAATKWWTSPQKWIKDFCQYRQITTLTRMAMVTLVDRVVIEEGGGVDVWFRRREEIRNTLAQLNQLPQEKIWHV